MRILINLLRERLEEKGFSLAESRMTKLVLPSSAFVSGYSCSFLNEMDTESNEVFIPKTTIRMSQRVVAKKKFYKSKDPRLDCVMIEAEEDDNVSVPDGNMRIWFAKVLCFIRIRNGLSCGNHHHKNMSYDSEIPMDDELCYIQFFEVVPSRKMHVDKVDEVLNCIRVQWQRTEGETGKRRPAKVFGLVPIDAIRGKVNLVPADTEINSMSSKVHRKAEYDKLRNQETGWAANIFYVNRFYKPRGEFYEHKQDGEMIQ